MKKFAICCLALVVVSMFVPAAQAATKCYHLTNFIDGLEVTTIFVGGIQANEVVGLWDWVGSHDNTGTLVSGGPNKFGTHPTYPFDGGFQANFTFKGSTHLFDLYGTFDGFNTFAFQTNQPYTTTGGVCSPLAPGSKTGLRPSTIIR
jgi:hypothetical protein